jgi:hypothetical protein
MKRRSFFQILAGAVVAAPLLTLERVPAQAPPLVTQVPPPASPTGVIKVFNDQVKWYTEEHGYVPDAIITRPWLRDLLVTELAHERITTNSVIIGNHNAVIATTTVFQGVPIFTVGQRLWLRRMPDAPLIFATDAITALEILNRHDPD